MLVSDSWPLSTVMERSDTLVSVCSLSDISTDCCWFGWVCAEAEIWLGAADFFAPTRRGESNVEDLSEKLVSVCSLSDASKRPSKGYVCLFSNPSAPTL